MTSPIGIEQSALRTPRSAAFAGMIFALLTLASLVTVHFALPHVPADSADLLTTSPKRDLLLIGLSLIPFAAVAFLWFVGVLLVGEAVAAGMVMNLEPKDAAAAAPAWWAATRNISTELLEAALQMAGVFTTATATLLWRTRAAPRWLTFSGTVLSVLLFFALYLTQWIGLLFPAWIFALSLYILIVARRDPERPVI